MASPDVPVRPYIASLPPYATVRSLAGHRLWSNAGPRRAAALLSIGTGSAAHNKRTFTSSELRAGRAPDLPFASFAEAGLICLAHWRFVPATVEAGGFDRCRRIPWKKRPAALAASWTLSPARMNRAGCRGFARRWDPVQAGQHRTINHRFVNWLRTGATVTRTASATRRHSRAAARQVQRPSLSRLMPIELLLI
jgi:hypothetical protein